MTRDEIIELQTRVKFCMKRRVPVEWNGSEYIPSGMFLRYRESDGFYYTVELTDKNRLNSTVTVGLDEVEWPSEGGGFKIGSSNQ